MPSEIKQRMQTTHTSCETIDQLGNRHELWSSSQPQGMQNLYLFNTPSLANLTNTGLILSVSGQLAASGGIRCNILLSSGVLSLFPGLPLAKFYPQWIHSRSTKGVDGFGHYPWNLHCPLPQALLYLLHRLYVTLPLWALGPEATEVSVQFYTNCVQVQLSAKLLFFVWVFEKRDDMLSMFSSVLSTPWTFKL